MLWSAHALQHPYMLHSVHTFSGIFLLLEVAY